ncbi:hypothetical protein JCM19233_1156 [Vibrio astriarenae]|nr:hypothetical protein JCM19233_1156 [Vibrio sp. C7]
MSYQRHAYQRKGKHGAGGSGQAHFQALSGRVPAYDLIKCLGAPLTGEC